MGTDTVMDMDMATDIMKNKYKINSQTRLFAI